MSIFKTEVSPGIVTATDSVVRSEMDTETPEKVRLPGFKRTSEMDVVNLSKGAVRRKSGG